MDAGQLSGRVIARLSDNEAAPVHYSADEILALLNEGQRLFVLLTLCLEAERELPLDPGQRWYAMLGRWSDWILPRRVRLSGDTAAGVTALVGRVAGATAKPAHITAPGLIAPAIPKLRPTTISELHALDAAWMARTGTPRRYGVLGFDLLFLDNQPTQLGQKLIVTYARGPAPMLAPADVPEIPEHDHPALVDWAMLRVRIKEGGLELEKAVKANLPRFLDTVKARAAVVRTRSIAQGYDRIAPELKFPDLSRKRKAA